MKQKFLCALVVIIISVGSIFVMVPSTAYANPTLPTGKIWKITANGEKGDLKMNAPIIGGPNPGWITGTIHWTGRGGSSPYTAKIFGYWDDVAWKITFLQRNEIDFDPTSGHRPYICSPASETGCHGRDQLYTGYLFGGGGPNNDIILQPATIAGSWEAFGGSSGVGASAHRTIFGWCATYVVDACAPLGGASYKGLASTTNATNMSNESTTLK